MSASHSSDPPKSGTNGRASEAAAFIRRGASFHELTPLTHQRFRLRLGGTFSSPWLSALCRGLAERTFSIEQAHAWLSRDGAWVAEITFTALNAAHDPRQVDYLALLAADVSPAPLAPVLDRFSLTRTADYGGTLLLHVEARDMLGLLGSILAAAAHASLFPVEMHIDTRSGRADDRLWLSHEGSVPSEEAEHRLAAWLNTALHA